MTLETLYGSRPDLLPRSMVRLARTSQPTGGRLGWVGRPGVELLDLPDHLRYERRSVARFPRAADGTIEWELGLGQFVIASMQSDAAAISQALREYGGSSSDLILFWGSLAVPTVKAEREILASTLADVVNATPDFWIYSPANEVLLEHAFSGVVTVANVPAEPAA